MTSRRCSRPLHDEHERGKHDADPLPSRTRPRHLRRPASTTSDGRPALARPDDPQRRRARRACRPGGRRLLRDRRAPHRRLPDAGRRRRARRDRGTHDAHPPRLRGHRAQLRRPRAGVPALLHAQRALGRPRRGHPRTRARASSRSRCSATTSPTTRRLFEEKTNLFAELLKGGPVTWEGTTRPALHDQDVVPHLESGPLPVWIGVGGSPESVVRAARYGFSLMLAIIGGPPPRFAPFSQLFRQALEQFGQPARPVGVHAPGHVADTDEQARERVLAALASDPDAGREGARLQSADGGIVRTRRRPRRRPLRRSPRRPSRRRSSRTSASRCQPLRPQVRHARPHPRPGDGDDQLYGTRVIPRVRELLDGE